MQKVSIIPEGGSIGRVTWEALTLCGLEAYPPALQRSNGRMMLLKNLAGYGAQIVVGDTGGYESLLDMIENEHDEYEENPGHDLARALRIAEIMAKPFMPVSRILTLADKWTMEMLNIPAVWDGVETVAGMLIERGEVAFDELRHVEAVKNVPFIFSLPRWRRRVS